MAECLLNHCQEERESTPKRSRNDKANHVEESSAVTACDVAIIVMRESSQRPSRRIGVLAQEISSCLNKGPQFMVTGVVSTPTRIFFIQTLPLMSGPKLPSLYHVGVKEVHLDVRVLVPRYGYRMEGDKLS